MAMNYDLSAFRKNKPCHPAKYRQFQKADFHKCDSKNHSADHEADDERTWKRFSDTLSGFLMYILCAVLSCETYETAQEVLEDEGWEYIE